MSKFVLVLLIFNSLTSFAEAGAAEFCKIKLSVSNFRFSNSEHVCGGGDCWNTKESAWERNREKIERLISRNLESNGFGTVEGSQGSAFTLVIDAQPVTDCGGWGSCDYSTKITLSLKDSRGSVIEEVSAESRAATEADSRYSGNGQTYGKHKNALKKALNQLQTTCPVI